MEERVAGRGVYRWGWNERDGVRVGHRHPIDLPPRPQLSRPLSVSLLHSLYLCLSFLSPFCFLSLPRSLVLLSASSPFPTRKFCSLAYTRPLPALSCLLFTPFVYFATIFFWNKAIESDFRISSCWPGRRYWHGIGNAMKITIKGVLYRRRYREIQTWSSTFHVTEIVFIIYFS